QNIRQEICRAEKAFCTDLAVQAKGQDQADHVGQNCGADGQLKGKQVRTANAGITKQVNIVTEAYPVVGTKTSEVCETVDHTTDQRDGVKTYEQCQDRYCDQQIRPFFIIFHSIPTPFLLGTAVFFFIFL